MNESRPGTNAATGSEPPAPESVAATLLAALGASDRAERARAITGASQVVDPDSLIEAVADHADSRKRNAAIEALALGGARSVPALIRALRHADPEVVMFSAGILARTQHPAAIPHLVSLLDHPDINVVQQVIDSLSQLRSSLAVGSLVRVLDRDPWLRFAAIHALGEIGDHRAVGALAPLLEDNAVRDVAIAAMGKIGSADALGHLFNILRSTQDGGTFGQCLRAIGDALEFQPNEDALRNIGDWTRLVSSASPAELDQRLQSVLAGEENADEEAGDTRKAAASIVRALRLRPLYTSLVLAGRDPSLRDVLEFSAVSLGEEIVPALTEGLSAAGASVRRLACECLGAMGQKGAAPLVTRLLGDEVPEVRAAAISALMRLGHDASVPAIAERLEDRDEIVREVAVAALGRMDVEAVAQALVRVCAKGSAPSVAVLAIMRANPHPGQQAFIRICLADRAPAVRRAAAEALARQAGIDVGNALEPLLVDPATEVRSAVIEILGGLRSARARQLLLAQLERDPETRPQSVRALGHLGDTTVIPLLFNQFDGQSSEGKIAIVEAVSTLVDPAIEPFLARQLGSADQTLRRAAVLALGRLRSATAVRQLSAAARDPDESVRAAVAEALSRDGGSAGRDVLARLSIDPSRKVAMLARQALERLSHAE
jgi:HEAT repeat protein